MHHAVHALAIYCKLIILWGRGIILFHLSMYISFHYYSNFKRQVTDNCGLALAVPL